MCPFVVALPSSLTFLFVLFHPSFRDFLDWSFSSFSAYGKHLQGPFPKGSVTQSGPSLKKVEPPPPGLETPRLSFSQYSVGACGLCDIVLSFRSPRKCRYPLFLVTPCLLTCPVKWCQNRVEVGCFQLLRCFRQMPIDQHCLPLPGAHRWGCNGVGQRQIVQVAVWTYTEDAFSTKIKERLPPWLVDFPSNYCQQGRFHTN